MSTPNTPASKVTVVVVVRDHYAPTLHTVRAIVESVPVDVPVLVVAGAMPRTARRRLESLDRVKVIGPRHHLMANTARNLALEHVNTPLVAFIDNDTVPERNWLTMLVETLEAHGATAVMPVVMERFGPHGTTRIHLSGGECRIEQAPAGRRFITSHRHLHAPAEAAAELEVEQIHLLEFHCALYHRERLMAVGAFDEGIEAQGEHLDLTLRIHQAGGSIWLDPRTRATIAFPTSLAWRDLALYLGRWSPTVNQRSRTRLVEKWQLHDTQWHDSVWGFASVGRSYPWLRAARVVQRTTRRWTPEGIAQRFDRYAGRHLAELLLRVAPGWRQWRHDVALARGRQSRIRAISRPR